MVTTKQKVWWLTTIIETLKVQVNFLKPLEFSDLHRQETLREIKNTWMTKVIWSLIPQINNITRPTTNDFKISFKNYAEI
mgnify:CR=1 FL=1